MIIIDYLNETFSLVRSKLSTHLVLTVAQRKWTGRKIRLSKGNETNSGSLCTRSRNNNKTHTFIVVGDLFFFFLSFSLSQFVYLIFSANLFVFLSISLLV